MALPGRIILKQSPTGKAARDTIMRGLSVTGILNGSDLEKTPVWPKMDLPFMLLFARNSVPKPDHHFHFVTPIRENRLSTRGIFRLDYKSAETVAVRAVIEKPWLLKALAVGTVLDVEVVERLPHRLLSEFWDENDLYSGKGYDLSPDLEQRPAVDLCKLPDFEVPEGGFSIPLDDLPTWQERHNRQTAHFPRNQRLYAPPLLIIPQTPHESREQPKAFVSLRTAVAFSQSNYGFSAATAKEGEALVSMLYLVVHSKLFQHFCLMKSSRQGASFRTIIKEDLAAFPFPDPRRLDVSLKHRLAELARALQMGTRKPWEEIDDFIFSLYGLDEHDAGVVRDTVALCGPYQSVRDRAEEPVPPEEIGVFCQYLEDMLQPLFGIAGQRVVVSIERQNAREWFPAWQFFSVTLAGDHLGDTRRLMARLMLDASKTGASRITVRVPDAGLLVGILNARRFWTRSRARLCSLYIEQHHMDAFPIGKR
jgi:hypothetical protein